MLNQYSPPNLEPTHHELKNHHNLCVILLTINIYLNNISSMNKLLFISYMLAVLPHAAFATFDYIAMKKIATQNTKMPANAPIQP